MIWKQAKIEYLGGSVKDSIGNIIEEVIDVNNILVRATEWSAEDIKLYGREVTSTNRKLITPSKIKNDNARIVLNGLTYSITTIKAYRGRGLTVLFIERANNAL